MNPDNTEFHFDLGNALWDQGRLDEAHRELEIAVALDSTNVRALNNLALSAALRDEEARAIDLWKQTLRHHPGNYVARCNLAFYDLERSGRIEEALEQYARALRDYQEEKSEGRRAQAVGRADPGAPSQVYAMLGHAHLLLGQTEPALRYLRESTRLPHSFPLAFVWLAETLVSAARDSTPIDSATSSGTEGSNSASVDPSRPALDDVEAEASREFQRLLQTAGPVEAFHTLAERLRAGGAEEPARIAHEIAEELGQEETAGSR
jgi:tetratricopeptide (TPR) repeat protein